MCQSSAPAPPDYTGASVAQGAANLEAARATAKLSNPNIVGPLGSQTVTYGTGDQQDIPTVTQTLTPDAQATLESQQAVQKNLAGLGLQGIGTAQNALDHPFDPNLPGIQTGLGDAGSINQGPNAGLYGITKSPDLSNVAAMPVNAGMTAQNALLSRLEPSITQAENATRQRLANQGLVSGGEAYNNEMRDQGNQENDLRLQAALQGINLDLAANNQGYSQALQSANFGNQATGQDFGQNLTSAQQQNAAQGQQYNQLLQNAQFGNTAQGQSLQQQLALRNQPLNEISGLMSGSQIQLPQFQGYQGSNVAPAPVFAGAQAQGAADNQQYGISQAGANANTAGLYGLGAAGLGAYLGKK